MVDVFKNDENINIMDTMVDDIVTVSDVSDDAMVNAMEQWQDPEVKPRSLNLSEDASDVYNWLNNTKDQITFNDFKNIPNVLWEYIEVNGQKIFTNAIITSDGDNATDTLSTALQDPETWVTVFIKLDYDHDTKSLSLRTDFYKWATSLENNVGHVSLNGHSLKVKSDRSEATKVKDFTEQCILQVGKKLKMARDSQNTSNVNK